MKLDPIDAAGEKIKVGSTVRVVGIPDLGSMARKQRQQSQPVFEYLVGKYKKVHGFNQFGLVELQFSISAGDHRGWHGVAIEPSLLRVRQSRKKYARKI